jgi:hypothetical protein
MGFNFMEMRRTCKKVRECQHVWDSRGVQIYLTTLCWHSGNFSNIREVHSLNLGWGSSILNEISFVFLTPTPSNLSFTLILPWLTDAKLICDKSKQESLMKNCVKYCWMCFKIELIGATIHALERWNKDIKFCLFNETKGMKNRRETYWYLVMVACWVP